MRLERFLQANPDYQVHHQGSGHEESAKQELAVGHGHYQLFEPFISCPPGKPLRRVGRKGDGGKWLCGMETMQAPCSVISLGSRNDYTFEEAVLEETQCSLATLDCTIKGPGRVLDAARHRFFKKCISGKAALNDRPDFMTYEGLVTELGLPPTASPLLKIDVELYEYAVMSEWTEHTPSLPEQIALEVHFLGWRAPYLSVTSPIWGRRRLGLHDLGLFFMHLANLGYGIVNKEDNPYCPHCTEVTLLRVEAPAAAR
ncbi:hypothetical protein HYH03_006654 [Edaphochlamys debaryana]|uniref:Methyltransferase domain-containing protein n=1 Tax=Edaphochlamys debaryana TaxID=47281 RepID=A0A836C031_9CHLO|nr:hypothetical protein HYH03_006654 [Edaphochlamys debaryana]|eukprot:KAG2495386.1 hypothetical protein HYH03_006654 [Edaphochlamys debaryana]